MVTDHIGKSYPNLIRAKMLGEANDDVEFISESHDSAIPIFKGIVIERTVLGYEGRSLLLMSVFIVIVRTNPVCRCL